MATYSTFLKPWEPMRVSINILIIFMWFLIYEIEGFSWFGLIFQIISVAWLIPEIKYLYNKVRYRGNV